MTWPPARWLRFAACSTIAWCAACDVEGVTPVCPPDAGTCVTLPPGAEASAAPSDDATADGADGGTAASQ